MSKEGLMPENSWKGYWHRDGIAIAICLAMATVPAIAGDKK